MKEKHSPAINFSNQNYVLKMHAIYQNNPQDLDKEWLAFFQGMEFSAQDIQSEGKSPDLQIKFLIEAYKKYGHLIADTNPMIAPLKDLKALELSHFGFNNSDLEKVYPTLGLLKEETAPLKVIIERLKEIYCGQISYECFSIENQELEKWFHSQIMKPQENFSPKDYEFIISELYRAKELENFLQKKFLGAKRFSIEGAETFMPMLKELFTLAAKNKYQKGVIGMAHRGRINVLTNLLAKPYAQLIHEFNTKSFPSEQEGMGDVKYHKGFKSELTSRFGDSISLILASNPSHLESVDPVVMGMTKAFEQLASNGKILPVLVHGDASLAGQGVVYETMQLCKIKGYEVGGIIHIVINNQVGFTATSEQSRSTMYCTDIAKAFGSPVIHVNGENPTECLRAMQLAFQVRDQFGQDVFIDLQCHRFWGHNEADEPMYTNPELYKKIKEKDHIYKSYSKNLLEKGFVTQEFINQMEKSFSDELNQAYEEAQKYVNEDYDGIISSSTDLEKAEVEEFKSEIKLPSIESLKQLAEKISSIPKDFNAHPKIVKLFEERRQNLINEEDKNIVDWASAELLAYAYLLEQKIHIRISGQDSIRGTFSHRHARIIDQQCESTYTPLEHISQDQASFTAYNSALSEFAVMGFEFGYSISYPNSLVIWEGQFGDFANGAQVIIDQYLSGCETKWGMHCPLTLFLPHGYEGMGSEHSSCRIERFLQLAGLQNWRVCHPSTPAQMFHLLCSQALKAIKKPLIIATPKSMLRQVDTFSKLSELANGQFEEILDDEKIYKKSKKLIICSGKIGQELIRKRLAEKEEKVAIIRIEQLYPLNIEKLTSILESYKDVEEFLYVQEEPQNQGAYTYLKPYLIEILGQSVQIKYKGRIRNSIPDTGFVALFKKQQEEIIESSIKG